MSTHLKPYANPKPLNSRQKQVCVNLASGMPQGEAWASAGYPAEFAQSHCSDFITNNRLAIAYLDELNKRKADMQLAKLTETIASPLERKAILSEILRARLIDFTGDDGQPNLSKDTPNNRAAKEFYHKKRYDREGNPIVTKSIKLTDPIAAIQELNKMDGSYAPSKHVIAQRVQFEIEYVEKKRIEEE